MDYTFYRKITAQQRKKKKKKKRKKKKEKKKMDHFGRKHIYMHIKGPVKISISLRIHGG